MAATPTATRTLELAWPDGRREPLRLAPEPFAEGGDARLFAVEGRPELVAKMYRRPAAEPQRRAKLDAMLAHPPAGITTEHGGRRWVQLAWPLALVEDADPAGDAPGHDAPSPAPLGFVMPRVDLGHAAELELLLSARGRRAAGLPEAYRTRVTVAHNLAAAVAALHAEGDHVIDLKPANVHVHRGAFFVAMLDCDGFSIGSAGAPEGEADGGVRYPAHQYTDGYIAPEALRARQPPEALGEAQDRFALAVVAFRLLAGGLHPFQGVPRPGATVPTTDSERVAAGLYPYGRGVRDLAPPPGSLYGHFDPATRGLFDAAFGGVTADRPSAEAWRRHLRKLLDVTLRPCAEDPDHARFGDLACGACAVARTRPAAAGAPPNPTAPSPPPWAEAVSAWASAASGKSVPPARVLVASAALLILASIVLGYASGWGPRERAADDPSILVVESRDLPSPPEVERAATLNAFASRNAAAVKRAILDGGIAELWALDTHPASYGTPVYGASSPCWRQLHHQTFRRLYLQRAVCAQDADVVAALVLYAPPPSGQDEVGGSVRLHTDGRTALMTAVAYPQTMVADSTTVGIVLRAASAYADDALREHTASVGHQKTPLDATDALNALFEASEAAGRWTGGSEELIRAAAVVYVLLRSPRDPPSGAVGVTDTWGRTALAYAAASANTATAQQLLDAGADPNAADAFGVTPLMHAADLAEDDETDALAAAMVTLLLEAGADPEVRSRSGHRAADYVGRTGGALATSWTLARLRRPDGASAPAPLGAARRADVSEDAE